MSNRLVVYVDDDGQYRASIATSNAVGVAETPREAIQQLLGNVSDREVRVALTEDGNL